MLPPSVVLLPKHQVLCELAGDQGMGTGGTEKKGRSQMQDSLARGEELSSQYVVSKLSDECYLVSVLK